MAITTPISWAKIRVASACGSQSSDPAMSGQACCRAFQPTQPTTVIFSRDFAASIRLRGPKTRPSPVSGLSFLKSGRRAASRIRKPVCTITPAPLASRAARANGPIRWNQAMAALRMACAGSWLCASDRIVDRVCAAARAASGRWVASSQAPAVSTARPATSRESGVRPSSRACCSRLADAASVLSSASPAMFTGRARR